MNYFAHALPLLLDDQHGDYALAGIATPDWLGVVAKRTKCRTRHAEPLLSAAAPQLADFAWGVVQHHADDAWFHDSAAFNRLSLEFAKRLRLAFSDADGMRPWFLGHILVELLLDDALIAAHPGLLDDYYARIAALDADWIAHTIATMTARPVGELPWFIGKYVESRFLADYADDSRLRFRLNQVMKRVSLPELPEEFEELLPGMRAAVGESRDELVRRA